MEGIKVENYLNGLKNGKILGTRCKKCGNIMIPQKPVCSECGSFDVEEIETSGEGTIKSFTVIHVAPEKLSDKVPYVVAIVQLKEGKSIMGRLLDVDPNRPEEIKIGTKVKFKPLFENGENVVAFKIMR